MLENRRLLDGFREGRPAALQAVYLHFQPDVERALSRGFPFRDGERSLRFFGFSRSYELSDAIQDTFAKAFAPQARLAYNGLDPYRPYLVQMARNVVIDRHRRARISPERLSTLPDGASDEGAPQDRVASPVEDPETTILQAEARALVADFVSGQDEQMQALLRVHFDEDRSQEAAAAALGLRRSEVRAQVEVIRGRLLRFLKARGFIESVDRASLFRALEGRR